MDKIKVIKIDALHQTVTEIEIEPVLRDYYAVLDCSMIEVACYLSNDDFVFVDEEGLLNNVGYGFQMPNSSNPQPFVGNGIVVASDEDGHEVTCTSSIEEIRSSVVWWNNTL